MALIEPEAMHSKKVLIMLGIPAFIGAVIISVLVHQYAHSVVKRHACSPLTGTGPALNVRTHELADSPDCPWSSLAGVAATTVLALASFGIFIHAPRNLFLASMAFVNSTARLGEVVAVLTQFIMRQKEKLVIDETIALKLFHFSDPTAYILILGSYALGLFFFTTIIIHDIRMVPRKWVVAAVLFIILGPMEKFLLKFVAPFAG